MTVLDRPNIVVFMPDQLRYDSFFAGRQGFAAARP
ncbi:MAG: hypothetical protein QOD30_1671 [Actinomycetota bacterium]|jgi:hypothetical protein|nr:hypothetical protein [Actinomycetota bacterium]